MTPETDAARELLESCGHGGAAFAGLIESQVLVLVAGFLSRRPELDFLDLVASVSLGTFVGRMGFFWAGRRWGERMLARSATLERRSARVRELLERHHHAVILLFRFAWGLRAATPVVLGTTGLSWARFAAWNAAGAVLWSVVFLGAGRLFGEALGEVLDRVGGYERVGVAVLVGGALLAWAILRLRRRHAAGEGTS